jgi:mycothiol synthase
MVEIRPVETDDEHAVALELNNTIRPGHAVTLDDMRAYLAVVPQQHYLAWEGELAVGTSSVARQSGRPQGLVEDTVRLERRRQGIGSALYAALSAWAREQGISELEAWVDDQEEDGLAFARSLGFVEVGRELKVALDLEGFDPPAVDPPAGIEIVTWEERPELVHGMYEVFCEADPDIPGNEEEGTVSFEGWLTEHMTGPGDSPKWTFVALAGDEVVGYAKFFLTEAQPDRAFHDLTGVKRAWRGRGIAGALKRRQIRWAKDNGYRRVLTNNEERNEPIRRLNERLGYKPALGRRLMRGPLA